MNDDLNIAVEWERLEEGAPEERACFGMLTFHHGDVSLTEGLDGFIERSRRGPLVSGYHLAEWMAWNWWRLVGEPNPRQPTEDWVFAHSLSTVGTGYLWPNITLYSDRERTVVIAKPTHPQGFAPFRFTADWTVVLPTRHFEAAVDLFMAQIQGKLRAEAIAITNFDRIWDEVLAERADPAVADRRQMEALLGVDPDERALDQVERLLADAIDLGQDAVREVAADHVTGRAIPTVADFAAAADAVGSDTRPEDIVQLAHLDLTPRDRVPAWERGYEAARALREQHKLGLDPLSNQRLAQLCAVSAKALERSGSADLAFSMDDVSGKTGRIVLRSKWQTGRRFELARLLGDRLTNGLTERLLPATRAYTYRQKLQRAFAAELLCPLPALKEKLAGDYSAEAREDAAHHFTVSERTVTTMLVNHRLLDRDYLDGDPEVLAA
jgi:hypothetical protein